MSNSDQNIWKDTVPVFPEWSFKGTVKTSELGVFENERLFSVTVNGAGKDELRLYKELLLREGYSEYVPDKLCLAVGGLCYTAELGPEAVEEDGLFFFLTVGPSPVAEHNPDSPSEIRKKIRSLRRKRRELRKMRRSGKRIIRRTNRRYRRKNK